MIITINITAETFPKTFLTKLSKFYKKSITAINTGFNCYKIQFYTDSTILNLDLKPKSKYTTHVSIEIWDPENSLTEIKSNKWFNRLHHYTNLSNYSIAYNECYRRSKNQVNCYLIPELTIGSWNCLYNPIAIPLVKSNLGKIHITFVNR